MNMSRNRIINLSNVQQFTAINVLSDPGHIPGPVLLPDGIQCIIDWSLTDGHPAHIVTYGKVAAGFTVTAAIAQALFTGLANGTGFADWKPLAPTTAALTGVSMRDVRSPNQPLVSSTGSPVAGTSASPALPDENALVVTLRTAKAGIAYRGRCYVPGWSTGTLGAGGVANPATLTAAQQLIQDWQSILLGQGLTLALGLVARAAYTGLTGRAHPARTASTEPITQIVARDNHWDSQRRRGLK
jgi:hypothetical protein